MSKKYKVPEGFDPVLDDDDNPIDGLADLWVVELGKVFVFCTTAQIPASPLKACGLLWMKGFDIPTYWAIDNNLLCWLNEEPGGELHPVNKNVFIFTFCFNSSVEEINEIKRILGMKVPVDPVTIEWGHVETKENEIPDWQQKALKAGWTPPKK